MMHRPKKLPGSGNQEYFNGKRSVNVRVVVRVMAATDRCGSHRDTINRALI